MSTGKNFFSVGIIVSVIGIAALFTAEVVAVDAYGLNVWTVLLAVCTAPVVWIDINDLRNALEGLRNDG